MKANLFRVWMGTQGKTVMDKCFKKVGNSANVEGFKGTV